MITLYSAIRDELKTGDLIAWNTPKVTSFFTFVLYMYQKILKAEYTHVGVIVREGSRVFVLEATPPVVRLYPLSFSPEFFYIPVNRDDLEDELDHILHALGKPYSLLDLIKGLLKIKADDREYYCSELASEFYNRVGYIEDEWAGLTPDTLVRAVCKAGNVKPVFVKNDWGNTHV